MHFEWNETKRALNYKKHGVDLLEAALIFDGFILSREDNRHDYGEVRMISLGLVDDEIYTVIHTERNNKTRLISAWKSGKKEYEQYKNSLP